MCPLCSTAAHCVPAVWSLEPVKRVVYKIKKEKNIQTKKELNSLFKARVERRRREVI